MFCSGGGSRGSQGLEWPKLLQAQTQVAFSLSEMSTEMENGVVGAGSRHRGRGAVIGPAGLEPLLGLPLTF